VTLALVGIARVAMKTVVTVKCPRL
jgi:hypothetical protein